VIADETITTDAPLAMVTDGESLWVLAAGGRIDRIDTGSQSVADSVTFGGATNAYQGLAVNADGLWATDSTAAVVYRVDQAPLALATSIPVGKAPKGVLANADGVWVADVHGGTVLRIDPATNEVVATITVGGVGASGPNWLAEGLGSIWVDVPNEQTIVRIDPITDAIQASIDAPAGFTPCGGIATLDDAAWVTNCAGGNKMVRVDANSNIVVATIDMGGNGYNPIVINGSLWISVDAGKADNGKLVRIDPNTNRIDRILVPSTTFGGGGDIVVAAGSVWVMDGYNNQVMRLPLTAFAP
jgi:YVTN family beta-propeller protein